MRKLLAVLLASTMTAAPVLAGSASDPEVSDETGDVDVQHLVEVDALDEADVSQEEAETVGDVDRAWVHTETRDSFQISVRLAEIPDQHDTSAPLVETWTHFTVNEADVVYHARAVLLSPQPEAPLQAEFQLYEGESQIASMPGNVDTRNDTLRFTVSKGALGGVTEGDHLTEPYVTTHLPGSKATLDYAPGAKRDSLPSPQQVDGVDPTSLDLAPDARFGDRYGFKSFTTPDADLSVSITPTQLEIEAGDQEQFSVRVMNEADAEDTVQLSTGTAPHGWGVRLDTGQLTVPPGESRSTLLYVSPPENAEGHELVDLEVTSDLGAQQGVTVSVTATQPDRGTGSHPGSTTGDTGDQNAEDGDAGTGDSSTGENPSAEEASPSGNESQAPESNDSPGLGLVTVLAATGVAGLLLRRRA